MDAELHRLLESFAKDGANLLLVTGEGVSGECGVASFQADPRPFVYRGRSWRARELTTRKIFDQDPEAVWAWHLERLDEVRRRRPGAVHQAAARAAAALGPRLKVITEGVDGLHRRCRHPAEGLFEPLGNLFFMRCAEDCAPTPHPVPEALWDRPDHGPLTARESALLRCPVCGGPARPHILWRDESCDEPRYGLTRILDAARSSALLVMAGFSGHTNLLNKVAWEITHDHRARIVDINPEPDPVAALARRTDGLAYREPPSELLPEVLQTFVAAAAGR